MHIVVYGNSILADRAVESQTGIEEKVGENPIGLAVAVVLQNTSGPIPSQEDQVLD